MSGRLLWCYLAVMLAAGVAVGLLGMAIVMLGALTGDRHTLVGGMVVGAGGAAVCVWVEHRALRLGRE